MPTVPILQVLLDDGTGTFPHDISSKVMNGDGYSISRGRADWIGSVTAGDLTLTLNNSDGRFTPGSTILGTPSPITVDQRIRVIEGTRSGGFGSGPFGVGPFGGGSVSVFTGYVKSWPVSWPAVVPTVAEVQITATDAQARAERWTLRSMLEEEILRYNPTVYYSLSEDQGATSAGDTSGNQGPALKINTGGGDALAFGSDVLGITADGTTGVAFPGTPNAQFLATDGTVATTGVQAVGVQFVTSAVPPVGAASIWQYGDAFDISLDSTGRLEGNRSGSPGLIGPASMTDGEPHFAVLVADPTTSTFSMVIDGTVVASASSTFTTSGPGYLQVATTNTGLNTFAGTVAKAVAWPTLTVAQAQSITALATGHSEASTARLARFAAYTNLPVGALDTSLTTVPAQATAGTSAWDAIQEVVDAEMGLAFVDGSGSLVFHNRSRVSSKTAPDLTLDSQYVTPDVQPVTDDQQIVNYFEATAIGTGAPSVARDTDSEDAHGRYPVSQTYLVQTDAEALDRANWMVARQAEPFTRYGTLTINLYKMTADMAATVISLLDLNCWLRITSMASQNPGGAIVDVVVQGWNRSATGESWAVTCNVVARSLYTAFVLDDPTFGVLDSGSPLFV